MKISRVCVSLSWPTGNNPISFRKLIQNNHTFGSISYWNACYFSPTITFFRINISWDFSRIFFAATVPVWAMKRLLLRAVSIMVLSTGYITLHFWSRFLQIFPLWDTKLLPDIKVSPFHTFDDDTGCFLNCFSRSVPNKNQFPANQSYFEKKI